jgi:hypothetical protein
MGTIYRKNMFLMLVVEGGFAIPFNGGYGGESGRRCVNGGSRTNDSITRVCRRN